MSQIAAIPDVLPDYPAFLGSGGLPQVTQSEIYYNGVFGSGNPQLSIPGEYLLIKPDYYDPAYYFDTGVPNPFRPMGGSDLPDLYEAASKMF